MKTPEEIKKGLEICLRAPYNDCNGCSYHANNCPECVESVVTDALAYIRQLEAERDAAIGNIHDNPDLIG